MQEYLLAKPSMALASALGQPLRTAPPSLPPLRHWLHFWPYPPHGKLGADGHEAHGDFTPPMPGRNRMWASSQLRFFAPLAFDVMTEAISTIADIRFKQGRSGQLGFVTVLHQMYQNNVQLMEECQHIVYYDRAVKPQNPRIQTLDDSSGKPEWSEPFTSDPTLLFRYSALTFNGHRIHYDADYCRDREQYPGLVVHAPLLATLMLDAWQRRFSKLQPRCYRFRANAPAFAHEKLILQGWAGDNSAGLRIVRPADHALIMQGDLEFNG